MIPKTKDKILEYIEQQKGNFILGYNESVKLFGIKEDTLKQYLKQFEERGCM